MYSHDHAMASSAPYLGTQNTATSASIEAYVLKMFSEQHAIVMPSMPSTGQPTTHLSVYL
jgi:hypothetical protein